MKKSRIAIALIMMMATIVFIGGTISNAEEVGPISIEKLDNGNLLFHDANEEITGLF